MLHKNKIYTSLYKPVLFVGCERLPFTLIITFGGLILMSYHSFIAIMLIIIYYLLSIVMIRRVNKTDPQFFLSLYRYIRYLDDYYPNHEFFPSSYRSHILPIVDY